VDRAIAMAIGDRAFCGTVGLFGVIRVTVKILRLRLRRQPNSKKHPDLFFGH